jgi:hypothetical protein
MASETKIFTLFLRDKCQQACLLVHNIDWLSARTAAIGRLANETFQTFDIGLRFFSAVSPIDSEMKTTRKASLNRKNMAGGLQEESVGIDWSVSLMT